MKPQEKAEAKSATAKPATRRSRNKSTSVKIEVSLDLGDVVRVVGWDKANSMLERCLAFASNKRQRINLKVTKNAKS